MSEEQQHVIDDADYQEHLKDVGKADFSQEEKDAFRKLLAAGYRNLNGDPVEKKVQMLARTDWLQIQKSIADSKKIASILSILSDIKARIGNSSDRPAEPPKSFSDKLFGFLTAAKRELATIICFAIFFPNGGKVLKVLASFVNPGVQP